MHSQNIPDIMHAPGHDALQPITNGRVLEGGAIVPPEWRLNEGRNFRFNELECFNAAENQWFEDELLHYLPNVLTRKLQAMTARSLLPVYFANDPGATSWAYKQIDAFGEAEFVDDWASDPPGTALSGTRVVSMVHPIRMAAGPWTIDDIARWAKTGRRLDTRHMDTARDGCLRKENKAAWLGDSSRQLHGVLSATAGSFTGIPVDAATGTFATRAGTPTNLLGDLHAWSKSIRQNSNDVETGGSLMILPCDQYDVCATTYLGTNADSDSVLRKFLANDGYVTTVVRASELKGAGAAGADVGVILTRDPRAIELIVISDLEVRPPKEKNETVSSTLILRTGGVAIKYPKAHRILSGI